MLIDAMKDAALLCHIHPHAGIKAIKKLLTNTANSFERLTPEESFGLHNETIIHPIRFYLEKINKRTRRRRGDNFIFFVTIQEPPPTKNKIKIGFFLKCFPNRRKHTRFIGIIRIKPS